MNLVKFFFGTAYILQIISTIVFVRESVDISTAVMISRLLSFGMLTLFWVVADGYRSKAGAYVFLLIAMLSPYLFSDAYMAAIDVILVFMSAIYFASRLSIQDEFYSNLAYGSLFVVIMVLALYYLGVIPTQVFEWDGRVKNSLGFSNPNTLFFYIFSSAFIFYGERVRVGFYACGVLMILLYGIVGSRTFMYAYFILLGFWLWPNLFELVAIKVVLSLMFGAVACLGLVITWFPIEFAMVAERILMIDVNELVSNRIDVLVQAGGLQSMLGILFGGLENTADSLYFYFYSSFGVLGIVLALLLVVFGLIRADGWRKTTLLVMCIVYFIIGLVEVPFDATSLMAVYLVYLFFSRGADGRQVNHHEYSSSVK